MSLSSPLIQDDVAEIAWRCFMEMRGVGITSVGEFHYFHHRRRPVVISPWMPPCLEAARMAGMRITLLQAAYTAVAALAQPLVRWASDRFDTS